MHASFVFVQKNVVLIGVVQVFLNPCYNIRVFHLPICIEAVTSVHPFPAFTHTDLLSRCQAEPFLSL